MYEQEFKTLQDWQNGKNPHRKPAKNHFETRAGINHLSKAMADLNIDPSQLRRPATKKKTTHEESTSMDRQFFEFYEHIFMDETVVFRDAGDAFKSSFKTR